jgi:hypothetical protein
VNQWIGSRHEEFGDWKVEIAQEIGNKQGESIAAGSKSEGE